MRYALSVEVKLVEMPDEELPEDRSDEPQLGTDPMTGIQNLMSNATKLLTRPPGYVFPMQPSGLDYRHQVAIRVGSFAALAKIIENYEQLTRTIQLERQ